MYPKIIPKIKRCFRKYLMNINKNTVNELQFTTNCSAICITRGFTASFHTRGCCHFEQCCNQPGLHVGGITEKATKLPDWQKAI